MNFFLKRWRALWRRKRLDRDLDDELRFHQEMRVEEAGSSAAHFGNATAIKEACRDL